MRATRRLPDLPPRPARAHKGDFGRVLVVGGSRGMAGAAVLAGRSALRAGAGLVRVATAESAFPAVAAQLTCCLTQSLPETRAGTIALGARHVLARLAEANDVMALGPGLGRHPSTDLLVARLALRTERPMVLDADALNALAADPAALDRAAGPRVLTPHPGEMARLCATDVPTVQADRQAVAGDFAHRHGCVVVLKGHETVATDGRRVYTSTTGNPGMATAGSGDVLTGVVAALLGQGLSPLDAAQLGVAVHGLAGDAARDRLGEVSLTARDIADALPHAFRTLR